MGRIYLFFRVCFSIFQLQWFSHFLFLSRQVENAVESTSPEKHLSGAVDAVKSETECLDRVTPLKVFLSPRESLRRNIQSKDLHLVDLGNKFD